MRLLVAISAVLAILASASPVDAQKCDTSTIAQRTYRSFGERLAVYVGDIQKTATPFRLRVLVGMYRRPFLSATGVLTEASLDKLLLQRRDIVQEKLEWGPRAKSLVNVKVDGRPMTVRVLKGGATDVVVEVCGSV